MKKVVSMAFLALVIVLSIQVYAQSKPTIAFVDNSSGNNSVIAQEIDAQFMSDVLSEGKFNVVTRDNSVIKTLINENELSSSGLTTDAASQLRLLGVTYYIMFAVLQTSSSQSSSNYSGNNSSGTNYEVDYYINTTLEVFNLTGQVLVSKDINEKGSGSYSYYSNQYGSGYNGSYNDAFAAAQQDAVNKVANDMKVLLSNMILLQGVIVDQVGGNQSKNFIINVGSNEGVQEGMKMTFVQYVYGVKETDGLAQVTGTGTNTAMIEVTNWPTKFSIIVGQTQVTEIPETTSNPITFITAIGSWVILTVVLIINYFLPGAFGGSLSPVQSLAVWILMSVYMILHFIFPNVFPL